MKPSTWTLTIFATCIIAKPCAISSSNTTRIVSSAVDIHIPTVLTCAAPSTATVTVTETATSSWPWSNPTYSPYPSVSSLPDDVDMYEAYAKIMASTVNETYAWWYMGLSSVLAGVPELPGLKSQTIQVFRVRHFNESQMRLDWTEMIGMGNFQTNEYATDFYNPLTGKTLDWSTFFIDGPASWIITRVDRETIHFELIQSSATIISSTIHAGVYEDRIIFTHIEAKYRSSSVDAGSSSFVQSTLLPIGSLADVRNSSITRAPGGGMYYAFFNGTVSSGFGYPNDTQGDTHIIGSIHKGGKSDHLFPYLWDSCVEQFPDYFNEDGELDPDWDSIIDF
ncbi:hypothetical protein G7Z17_g1432 [Cylindrodendrum hubeiense]|uniref:Uncharacterized protein n=1 Tax=Cylindrodendrum hubeiense TaxID=595255 RepID=A0A9P5HMT4_9HYPO|nr:hypothetical protein G7Z17_g1432 [Cylindrodendrum hubeiense]